MGSNVRCTVDDAGGVVAGGRGSRLMCGKMAMSASPSGGVDDFGDENGLFESHGATGGSGKVR